jgi:hypothetical protein
MGYTVKVTHAGLWTFLLGGLYFLKHGAWEGFFLYIILSGFIDFLAVLATGDPSIVILTTIVFNLVFAVWGESLVSHAYQKRGWVEERKWLV